MKKSKKILALLLTIVMVTALLPANVLAADNVDVYINIYWYGPEPTPIDITVMENFWGGYYFDSTLKFEPVTNAGGWDMHAQGYDGQFYKWHMLGIASNINEDTGDAFIAVNRSSVDGKWYVDKWDWNNVVYQPGMYTYQEAASFVLTSSAAHNGSITVNRSWSAGSTPVDTSYSLYRYTTVGTGNGWYFYKTVTMSKTENSLTFSSLFDGQYKIVQNLPQFYSDNYSGTSYTTTLSGGSSATASFTDTEGSKYNVTIPQTSGGALAVSPTSAYQGETVSVTVTPDTGNRLTAGTLKYNDGSSDYAISGTSFTMPGKSVAVSAEFEAAPPTEYAVNIDPYMTGGSIAANPTSSTAGGRIELTVTPDAGKSLITSSLRYNDGSADCPIDGTGFEMPESDVTISAYFKDKLAINDGGTTLPAGIIGSAYTGTITCANATVPFTWSADDLPEGLGIDPDSGAVSGTPTDTGNFSPTITITDANNETATASFNLTVNETFSIDLTGLSVSPGTLVPVFDKNTVAYGVAAGQKLDSIDVTAQTADPNALLSINNQPAASVVTQSVSLKQEANLIPVVVTSPDGLSQRAYIISVNGTINDACLSGLSIDGQTITPVFNPDTESYSLAVSSSTDSLELTAAPHDPRALMLLNGSLLSANSAASVNLNEGTNEIKLMVVAQDASTKTYTINVSRESVLTINNASLPLGIINSAYTATLSAAGGSAPYTWNAAGLPAGFSLAAATGVISGIPTSTGTYTVEINVTDNNGGTAARALTLKLNPGCGNGAYMISPDIDSEYSEGLTVDGIPTMTIKQGVTGLKYFSVTVEPVTGHIGKEVVMFVQLRNGQQIGISFNKADYDTVNNAGAAFNVRNGDIIKVFIVDDITGTSDVNPVIL